MKQIIIIIFIIASLQLHAQQFIPIWPDGKKPNFNGVIVKDSITNRVWQVGTPGFYAFIVQQEERMKRKGGSGTHTKDFEKPAKMVKNNQICNQTR